MSNRDCVAEIYRPAGQLNDASGISQGVDGLLDSAVSGVLGCGTRNPRAIGQCDQKAEVENNQKESLNDSDPHLHVPRAELP